LENVNHIAAARVSQAMQGIQARLSDIESRTGLTFSAYLMRSQLLPPSGTDSVAFAQSLAAGTLNEKNGLDFLIPETAAAAAPVETALTRLQGNEYDGLFTDAAGRYGLNAALIKAICFAESNFRPNAVSRSGAMGLMQLMPYTAEALGVADPFDPEQNIDGGARFLAQMLDRFGGDALLAIAAYNCGPNGVDSRGVTDLSDPYQRGKLPSQTQGYLARIEEYLGTAQALHVLSDPYAA
jgi:soluble lytic murein transglycosylase-like protein